MVEDIAERSPNFKHSQEESRVGSNQETPKEPDCRLFEEVVPGSLFERLVRAVRSVGEERLKKNYTTTFWYSIGAVPTNVAEETIVELCRLVNPPASCSGIEWWLGRLGSGERLRFHFDRDMTVQKKPVCLCIPSTPACCT